MTTTEKRNAIRELINAQNGRIFTARFVGKDGKEHTTNGRLAVCKYSHGGRNNAAGKEDLITVFNLHKMQYRNIYIDGVTEISAMGHKFSF